MEIAQLVLTLLIRAAKVIPDVIEAVKAGDADAEERLRVWLANQPEMIEEAKRLNDLVAAAKARQDGGV